MTHWTRMVILGDSVTAGYGLNAAPATHHAEPRFSPARATLARSAPAPSVLTPCVSADCYVTLLSERLAESGICEQVIPSALEGMDTDYALRRFDRMVTAHEPDCVVVMLGLNDALPRGRRAAHTPREYARNLVELANRIARIGAEVVLIAPHPRLTARGSCGVSVDVMRPLAIAMRQLARGVMVPVVDLHRRFLALANLAELLPDGVHPSAAGHRLIANILADELTSLVDDGAAHE